MTDMERFAPVEEEEKEGEEGGGTGGLSNFFLCCARYLVTSPMQICNLWRQHSTSVGCMAAAATSELSNVISVIVVDWDWDWYWEGGWEVWEFEDWEKSISRSSEVGD